MDNVTVYVDPKVRRVIELYDDLLDSRFYSLPIRRQLEVHAGRLTEAHHNGDAAVCFQIGSWHPDLVGRSERRIPEHVFTIDDGKVTLGARSQYGHRATLLH